MKKIRPWLITALPVLLIIGILWLMFCIIFECIFFTEYLFYGEEGNNKTLSIMVLLALSAGILVYFRNLAMADANKILEENYSKESHFKHFHEASELLTNKDATLEAKISSLYSLYEVSKSFNNSVSRVVQVVNISLVPLVKEITRQIDDVWEKEPTKKKSCLISLEDIAGKNTKQTINEWFVMGNEDEKLINVALKIQKKLIENVLLNKTKGVDLSNSILFNLDKEYSRKYKFFTSSRWSRLLNKYEKPIKNLTFLDCKLNHTSFEMTFFKNTYFEMTFFKNTFFKKTSFKRVNFHQCQFINCDLSGCDFSDANLWGVVFYRCNLKGCKFNSATCEGSEFIECYHFNDSQISDMKSEKGSNPEKKRIILKDNSGAYKSKEFSSRKKYIEWKKTQTHD